MPSGPDMVRSQMALRSTSIAVIGWSGSGRLLPELPGDRDTAGWVAEMVRPHNDVPGEPMRCGLGFFLHESRDQVMLIGQDAGVSFMSVHDPAPGLTYTVISNTADGAWPVLRHLRERFSA